MLDGRGALPPYEMSSRFGTGGGAVLGTRKRRRNLRPGSVVVGIALALCILAISQVFAAEEAHARYASIVIDAETGEVLRSRSADIRRYPASLTKMMTLYLLFEALDNGKFSLDSKLKVSKRAAGQSPSKLGLPAGSTIRAEDAIKALIVKSANDIAVVVAEALGGTEVEFAMKMTRKAKALGMSRTSFRNASGLPNRKQRSTARDMARLAQALMRDFPHRYHYFDDQRFRFKGREHRTPNKLLARYRGMDGIKTGYIRASGFNLVASAERDGRRVIAVVFGGKTPRSRNAHMANLLDLGFTPDRRERRQARPRPLRRRSMAAGRLRSGRTGAALQTGGDHGCGGPAARLNRRCRGSAGRADRGSAAGARASRSPFPALRGRSLRPRSPEPRHSRWRHPSMRRCQSSRSCRRRLWTAPGGSRWAPMTR